MHTSKSILIGALVLGAAFVPAGVVVTDLGVPDLPAAPGSLTVEAPVVPESGLRLAEPFGPIVLVPPAPPAPRGILGPVVDAEDFSEVGLTPVVLLPPPPGVLRTVRPPALSAGADLDEVRLVRPELARPEPSGRG
jgi:hypothetical protein